MLNQKKNEMLNTIGCWERLGTSGEETINQCDPFWR